MPPTGSFAMAGSTKLVLLGVALLVANYWLPGMTVLGTLCLAASMVMLVSEAYR